MNKDKIVRGLGAAVIAASLALVAATVGAGEITGNGKSLKNPDGTLNGNSACAFSGRQDTSPPEPGHKGVMAQSWGQLVKPLRDFLTSVGANPGNSCNPTRATGEP